MATGAIRRSSGKIKLAEPPPPEGVSTKEWDRHLAGKPGKVKSADGVDDIEGGDPMKLMPALRAIHKMGHIKQASEYRSKVQSQFDKITNIFEAHGAKAGTTHRRIAIPKDALTEGQLKQQLGFKPSYVSIPELGQSRFVSFRHPDLRYHVHDHGDFWTMHRDDSSPTAGVLSAAKHIFVEGAPALYGHVKERVSGTPELVKRIARSVRDEAERELEALPRIRPGKVKQAGQPDLDDLGAEFQSPGTIRPNDAGRHEAKEKDSYGYGFEYADLGPNAGEDAQQGPVTWKMPKPHVGRLKTAEHKLQGNIEFQGLPIAVENRAGSVREGTTRDGHHWRTKMKVPYGYIKGTEGADGEGVDVFVGPKEDAADAYVVHQHKPDGTGYDEDKVILGTESKEEAKELYLAHYDDPKFLGPISKVPVEKLQELVEEKKKLTKISQAQAAFRDELGKIAAGNTKEEEEEKRLLLLLKSMGLA